MPSKGLARKDIRAMDFDDRDGKSRYGIAHGDTRMCPRPRIRDHDIGLPTRCLHPPHKGRLVIRLPTGYNGTAAAPMLHERAPQFRKGLSTVQVRLARAKHPQIWAI